MTLTKRAFLGATLGAGGAVATAVAGRANADVSRDGLSNLAAGAIPISAEEHRARIEKAQQLMRKQSIAALILEAGSALTYFTGVEWWRSERFTGAVIPADGDITIVTPVFEEPSIRESMKIEAEVRTWNEDENPFALVAGLLADHGLDKSELAVEETTRFFIVDGVRRAAPDLSIVSGAPITRGCRMIKSAAELALMQVANDITIAAYRNIHPQISAGMSADDISALMDKATIAFGGRPVFSMALVGEASAYPHGSNGPQIVREGEIILMDCGCTVHGYESDISRTFVFGEPTKKQRSVWNTVKRGQELALETAQPGVEAGKVDDVVRDYYTRNGFGPGYKTPGLPHRLGHGIGLDGHEPVNFVHGEKTVIAPGMCFSNEPGIYLFGEFGVRLEDCLHMTDAGPELFSALSPSIDKPFG